MYKAIPLKIVSIASPDFLRCHYLNEFALPMSNEYELTSQITVLALSIAGFAAASALL